MEQKIKTNVLYVSPIDSTLKAKEVKSPGGRICITDRYLYDFLAYEVTNKYMENGALYYEVTDTKGYVAKINSNDVKEVDKDDIEMQK